MYSNCGYNWSPPFSHKLEISKFGAKISIFRLQAESLLVQILLSKQANHRMQKIENRYLTRKDFRNSYPIYIK